MLLVLISCAVYQMMISALKAVYLIILSTAYLIIVHKFSPNLFDRNLTGFLFYIYSAPKYNVSLAYC